MLTSQISLKIFLITEHRDINTFEITIFKIKMSKLNIQNAEIKSSELKYNGKCVRLKSPECPD